MKQLPFILLCLVGLLSCEGEKMILEYSDIMNFSLNVDTTLDSPALHLSGLALHSSLSVSKIAANAVRDTMHVTIYLSPFYKGGSGKFDYTMNLPNEINYITIGGLQKTVVWERKQ